MHAALQLTHGGHGNLALQTLMQYALTANEALDEVASPLWLEHGAP